MTYVLDYSVDVRDETDLDTPLATLAADEVAALTFSVRQNDVPQSSIVMPNDAAHVDDMDYGRVVVVSVDDEPAASFVIEQDHDDNVNDQGGAGQRTTFVGRPLVSLLDRGVCRPTLGYGRKPWAKTRVLSFASPEFDFSSWDYASLIVDHQADESTFYTGLPGGFPDPQAAWIGPSSGDDANGYIGHWYTVGEFTLASDTILVFFLAADNKASVYFDGFLLTAFGTDLAFTNTHTVTVFASAGTHRIAAKVTNYLDGGVEPGLGIGAYTTGNPTAFICSCYATDTQGRIGDLAIRTDDNWRILEYPDVAPGMTIHQAVGILLAENQADGLLTGWTLAGDDVNDYAGNAWDVLETVTVNVGDSILANLRRWSLAYLDFATPPTERELRLWRYEERGIASGVAYAKRTTPFDTNLAALAFDGVDAGTDCLTVGWSGGPPFRYPDSGGTRMGYLETNATTLSEAAGLAAEVINRQQALILQVTAGILPTGVGDVPLRDYDTGDTVTVPGRRAGVLTERVMEVVGTKSNRGLDWAVAVRDVHLSTDDRLNLALQRGSLGGTAPSSPADSPPPFGSKLNTSEITFHLQGTVPVGVSPVRKRPAASGNLYAFALTIPSDITTTSRIDVSLWVDGSVIGSGTISTGEHFALVSVDPIVWLEGNKTEVWPEVTATATEATDLLVEPRVL